MGSPVPEPIEFYAHLRYAHRHIASPLLTDAELQMLHLAEHEHPRSFGHHRDEFPISSQEVLS